MIIVLEISFQLFLYLRYQKKKNFKKIIHDEENIEIKDENFSKHSFNLHQSSRPSDIDDTDLMNLNYIDDSDSSEDDVFMMEDNDIENVNSFWKNADAYKGNLYNFYSTLFETFYVKTKLYSR